MATGRLAAQDLEKRLDPRLSWIGFLGNGLGATFVVVFLLVVFPTTLDPGEFGDIAIRTAIVFPIFGAIALATGWVFIQRRPLRALIAELESAEEPSDRARRAALRYPLDWALRSFAIWVIGAIISLPFIVTVDAEAGLAGAISIVLGGLTACSLQFLMVERVIRPLTALALAGGPPPADVVPGVAARLTMAWTFSTAVPLFGTGVLAAFDLSGADFDSSDLVTTVLGLTILALSVGLATSLFAARSVADPLRQLRLGLARVEEGRLDVSVAVDDGSEVGLLQAGFNRMTAGLVERERLRDAFGAFVDPSLTERVLQEGTDLAGEEVDLSLLFLDVREFTTFAERAEARRVVAALNDLYGIVVPIILEHGGHAIKFIGDGLLAVFGAPDRLPDHADRAVAAGLAIAALGDRGSEGLRVAVGINSGVVVAGTIGGGGRVDFTVIGDAVNTAARVEAATRQTGDDVLITEATLSLLPDSQGWVERPPIPLKGKLEPVRLFAPDSRDAGRAGTDRGPRAKSE